MNLFQSVTLAVAALSIAAPAHAITYIGSRTVGAGMAQLSITTDDMLGGLTPTDIIDWSIQFSSGAQNVSLFGPLSGNNSRFAMINSNLDVPNAGNSPLIATATALSFNFDNNAAMIFQFGPPFDSQPAYCLTDVTSNISCGGGNEVLFFGFGGSIVAESANRSGLVILASAAPAGVPEPTSWAMLIAGFGLIGAGIRRRNDFVRVCFG